MSRFFSLLCCMFALLATPHTASAGSQQQAAGYIEKLASQTLSIIQSDKAKQAKEKELEGLFARNVDIPWVGRFVMGHYWRKASEEQKQRYLDAYKQFLISHYAHRFSEYSSGDFKITGTETQGNGEYLVSMELIDLQNKNAQPVLVDYRVRGESGNFRVFDVIIEGVSMITTQRSEFASVISRNGIDHLIDQLANRSMPFPDNKS